MMVFKSYLPLIMMSFLAFVVGNLLSLKGEATHKCELEKSTLREQLVKGVLP